MSALGGIRNTLAPVVYAATSRPTITRPAGASDQAITGTGEGTLTFSKTFWKVGSMFRLRMGGYYKTDAVAPTYTLEAKFGSTVLWSSGAAVLVATQDAGWFADVTFICTAIGATGAVLSSGVATFLNNDPAEPSVFSANASTNTPVTLDTEAEYTLSVTADLGAGGVDVDYTLRVDYLYLERLV